MRVRGHGNIAMSRGILAYRLLCSRIHQASWLRLPVRLPVTEEQEETGWKYIHGDVFRPPPQLNLFAACVGTGTQILAMAVAIFALALVGVFYPYNRGALLTACVVSSLDTTEQHLKMCPTAATDPLVASACFGPQRERCAWSAQQTQSMALCGAISRLSWPAGAVRTDGRHRWLHRSCDVQGPGWHQLGAQHAADGHALLRAPAGHLQLPEHGGHRLPLDRGAALRHHRHHPGHLGRRHLPPHRPRRHRRQKLQGEPCPPCMLLRRERRLYAAAIRHDRPLCSEGCCVPGSKC